MKGPEIQANRMLLGMDANGLADWLGVDRRTVRRWETAESPLPDAHAARIQWAISGILEHAAELVRVWTNDVTEPAGGEINMVIYRSQIPAGLTASMQDAAAALACAQITVTGRAAHFDIVESVSG